MSNEIAHQACSFLLARLQTEIFRLKQSFFPGHHPGPKKFLDFISGVVDTAAEYLSRASVTRISAADAGELIKDAELLGDIAYRELLVNVARTDATQIPHQIVAPFQRWVERLGIQNTIFFRAEHLPNYEITTLNAASSLSHLKYASSSLTAAVANINWPILWVTVPGHSMGMLPHYAVVAHELGHAIDSRVALNLTAHQQEITDCLARIEARLKTANVPFDPNTDTRPGEIFGNWRSEILADAVGHILAGPAFFFALFGFLELSAKSYGISPTHPPSDLRRRLLFNELTQGTLNFVSVAKDKLGLDLTESINSPNVLRCPSADSLFSDLVAIYPIKDAAICVELIPLIEAIFPTVLDAAKAYITTTCADLSYSPEQYEFDLSSPLELLCELVPPIEFRASTGVLQASSLASILNIGWAALLVKLDKIPETSMQFGSKEARKMERLHELLLKAVELSEARLLWTEHK